jgi:hypothetical protein
VNAALVTALVGAVSALVAVLASRAQIAKLRAEAALTNESVADRQFARLEAEVARLVNVTEYMRNEARDCDRRLRFHRDGWWRVYQEALVAGIDLSAEAHPPTNGEDYQ